MAEVGAIRRQVAALDVQLEMALALEDGAARGARGLAALRVHRVHVSLERRRLRDLTAADVALRLHLFLRDISPLLHHVTRAAFLNCDVTSGSVSRRAPQRTCTSLQHVPSTPE